MMGETRGDDDARIVIVTHGTEAAVQARERNEHAQKRDPQRVA
jgi:hypothetical protein